MRRLFALAFLSAAFFSCLFMSSEAYGKTKKTPAAPPEIKYVVEYVSSGPVVVVKKTATPKNGGSVKTVEMKLSLAASKTASDGPDAAKFVSDLLPAGSEVKGSEEGKSNLVDIRLPDGRSLLKVYNEWRKARDAEKEAKKKESASAPQ